MSAIKKSTRTVSVLLLIALLCSFMMISAFAAGGGLYGIVNGDAVRLRTSMSTADNSNVLGLLYKGERINITNEYTSWAYGYMADGGNAGKWGYVAKQYLNLYIQ